MSSPLRNSVGLLCLVTTLCLAVRGRVVQGEGSGGIDDLQAVVWQSVRILLAQHDPNRFQPISDSVGQLHGSQPAYEHNFTTENSAIAPSVDAVSAPTHPGSNR